MSSDISRCFDTLRAGMVRDRKITTTRELECFTRNQNSNYLKPMKRGEVEFEDLTVSTRLFRE